jgi:hypothetical protein
MSNSLSHFSTGNFWSLIKRTMGSRSSFDRQTLRREVLLGGCTVIVAILSEPGGQISGNCDAPEGEKHDQV